MTGVVLITGVSRFLGGAVAARLATDPDIERVIGVDTIPVRPEDAERLGRIEFVRADIRTPLIAKVIAQAKVTTVVHTAPHTRGGTDMRDLHLTGAMQLLAGAQLSESVARVVVASSTAVYGSGPRNPAAFTENMRTASSRSGSYAREAIEVENLTRGFARRRPDIDVTVLRLAPTLGPRGESALSRYLATPVVPTSLGFDPRLQLLHEDDAAEVVRRASVQAHPGVFNVAGEGVVLLSQALRWAGSIRLPVPGRALSRIGDLVGNAGVSAIGTGDYLNFGCVVDTSRLRDGFGYVPPRGTAATLRSYLAGRPGVPNVALAVVVGAQRLLQDRVQPVAATSEG